MIYLLASIVIIVINVIPAFMPPTWTVVSFFYINYDTHLILLAFIAAISSSTGRFFLARSSKKVAPFVFSNKIIKNMRFIGSRVNINKIRSFVFAFLWAISPIASNPLFIGAGFSQARIRFLLGGFFLGRLLSYTSLAYASRIVANNLDQVFLQGVLDWKKVMMNAIGIFSILLYLMLDWEQLLADKKIRFSFTLWRKKYKTAKDEKTIA